MTRLEKFNLMMYSSSKWKTRLGRISSEEVSMIKEFLELNESLDFNEFVMQVNRMFLSSHGWPETKNAGIIQETLAALAKTKLNFYGYHGSQRWVHPYDRPRFDGAEWRTVDETADDL